MGIKRERIIDPSVSQAISNAFMEENAGIQKKQKESAFASSPTLACTFTADGGEEKIHSKNRISGYIFMCNGNTKADCYRYRVFGVPAARMNVVEKIRPRMTLFLFDFDLKLLYGVYAATSSGGLGIEPTAFGGKFSAQVKFEISKDCLPLPERVFKHAIRDNYCGGSKFRQELSNEQVTNLTSLFHPITIPPLLFSKTRPAAELSASYDQYLTELKTTRSGMPSSSREGRLATHSHVATSRSAAYWVALASEDREVVGSRKERMPSTLYASVSTKSALPFPSMQENSGTGTSHFVVKTSNTLCDSVQLNYQVPSYGETRHPLSPAVNFSDDIQHVYFGPHQGLLPRSAGLGAESLALPYSAPTVSHMSVPERNENEVNTHVAPMYGFHSTAEASLVPQQISSAHWNGVQYRYNYSEGASVTNERSIANGVQIAFQGLNRVSSSVHQLSSQNGIGYGYYGNGASVAKEMSRAYCQVPPQFPSSSLNTAAYLNYSNGANISGIAATMAPKN